MMEEIEELRERNAALEQALRSIDEWLLESQYPIDRRDLWNEQFLKAHDLVAALLHPQPNESEPKR